jgi:flagellar biosynthesis/type III secretory pathway protein FliH
MVSDMDWNSCPLSSESAAATEGIEQEETEAKEEGRRLAVHGGHEHPHCGEH